ncbi:rhomboid family intramembrane serine protease [Xenophilus azovorans]|uniref:rhomboid family intramembrane serine protease n=1 Tax=Xenophilus azovorans TaxID=151755 RepID=UPI00056E667A|nr:rhomboid family intramembrane serine protease [Xenophilus azovorans]
MFYAIPLENPPTWRNPPWMTVLLILLNVLVWWGPQRSEHKAHERAAAFYARSALPALEMPAYLDWLDATGAKHARQARRAYERKQYAPLLDAMNQSAPFLAKLRADEVVTPANPRYEEWASARRQYDAMLPAPFTARWAMDFNPDTEWRPVTLLTAAFLHGSTGHLLGNMLFLFLFGCTVELALGRATYLGFYLLGAVGASAMSTWFHMGQGGLGLGASGAVSALMAMYAVLYRMRRIRFFYQLFFYFNYVSAPALLLLPAWIANELLQQLLSDGGVDYMAHLGGLLTGATLMALTLAVRRVEAPRAPVPAEADDGHAAQVALARRLTGEMQFERAAAAWKAAARLRPRDAETLRQWFNLAKLWPAGEDFHRCARMIFALPGKDDATLALQHASYRTYLDTAKPGARLQPDDMVRLVRRFVRAREFADAEKLCQALIRTAPAHPRLADTLGICATGLLQAGQHERARAWLPQLQRFAPAEQVTRLLAQG